MYVCGVCACMHICVCMCIYVCVYICIYVSVCVCVCVCVCKKKIAVVWVTRLTLDYIFLAENANQIRFFLSLAKVS